MLLALRFTMRMRNLLQIRLSDDEKQAFEESAQISGISLSAWGRQQLRIAAIQELGRVGRKAAFLKPIPMTSDGKHDSI
jgi:hypothetical protein